MTENTIFQRLKNLKGVHWMRIESAMTGSGIPDLNGIANGIEFWVELKIGLPRLRPAQVAWHTRGLAQGRRVFVLTHYPLIMKREAFYALYQTKRYKMVDCSHFTPIDEPIIKTSILSDVIPCLTTTYKPDSIIN